MAYADQERCEAVGCQLTASHALQQGAGGSYSVQLLERAGAAKLPQRRTRRRSVAEEILRLTVDEWRAVEDEQEKFFLGRCRHHDP
ncbi:hypothetical protein [Micromonospora sp. NPDC049891]|uniref:hypothetical protein n=1 Tax=Micromonospora sp. NPDC049891 TaxID=3155655 RepID=UPI0034115DC9